MAKKDTTLSTADEKNLKKEYFTHYDAMDEVRRTWDEKEAMLISKNYDKISEQTKSQVNDGRLATIVLERAARVMAQLPSGQVVPLSKSDKGQSLLMDLALHRYILPNANAQFNQLIKMRLWDMYSMVYGVMPMLYDYSITDQYIGPDSWLIPVRNFVPQSGKISINDSDFAFVDTPVSREFLEGRRGMSGWVNEGLNYIIDQMKLSEDKPGKGREDLDSDRRTYVEKDRHQNSPGSTGKAAEVILTTKYEAGKDGYWITFAPDFDGRVVGRIKNPHGTGRIPIVLKHCFPLLDSIWGLGDFERGKTVQFAMNSLINLYLDGVKMSIFPPIMIDPTGVVASTVKYAPAAKWLMTKPQSINPYNVSPQGMTTFQSTYQFLISTLLNQNGTTDTSVTADQDPGFGKTPQALKMQAMRESSRDNWDRYMMEKAVEELYDGYINLLSQKQEKPINFEIFGEEIDKIKLTSPDVMQMVSKETAKNPVARLSIPKREIGNQQYKFYIDASSTYKKEQSEEMQAIAQVLEVIGKNPQMINMMQAQGKSVDLGELVKRFIVASGLQDPDKVVKEIPVPRVGKGGMATGAPSATNPNATTTPMGMGNNAGGQGQGQGQPQGMMGNVVPPGAPMPGMGGDEQINQLANEMFGGSQR